ncbi:MAG: hemolysin family protein [Bacteroidales bacterium]|jgi:CBS domain containing-hemolysin-like protein|nr:HlyC/CorC family transporter [Bacteroidales bacterium]
MNNVIIILLSLVFSAFFSGMEIAFVSSNKLRLELDIKQGYMTSRVISIFTSRPGDYIATMLVGNNISLVIYGILMAILLEPLISHYTSSESTILIIQTIISTLIILFTAEFLPKTIFRLSPNTALRAFAIPVLVFYILLYPVTKLTIAISGFILHNFMRVPRNKKAQPNVFGKIDLDNLVNESNAERDQQADPEQEIKLFQNALDFSNVKLRDCMVPRTEIVAFDESVSMEELQSKFIETGLSKILIYRESTDNIIGYINSKELFKNPSDLQSMIMSLPIVPETMPANKLLQSFIKDHKSISVVVDEFGGTSGIVTMEDILEEIIGEIEDEHDTSELTEDKLNEQEYIFSARHEIDYLNEKYRLNIPELDDYETLAGLILFHYESIPKINDRIHIEGFVIRILDVSETRIELIHLHCGQET